MSVTNIGGEGSGARIPVERSTEPTQPGVDSSSQRIEQPVLSIIKASQASRSARLEKLGPLLAKKISAFEQSLFELGGLALEYATLRSELYVIEIQLSSDEDDSGSSEDAPKVSEEQVSFLERKVDESQGAMTTFIEKLISSNEGLHLDKEIFSDYWRLYSTGKSERTLSLAFTKEQMMNRCVNKMIYLASTKQVVEENKAFIFTNFFKGDTTQLSQSNIDILLDLEGSETHHLGKAPVKVSFFSGAALLFSIFLKPRDASIDRKVIDLFKDINELPKEQKSIDVDLPTYQIVNLTSRGQSISIWEFVEGKKLEGIDASHAIGNLPLSSEREILHNQLLRLETICNYINISDLTMDNLIFQNLGKENPRIIPIDLESIQPGKDTGLYSKEPSYPPLTVSEINLLKTFKESVGDTPYRFVPIPTSHFLGSLSSFSSFVKVAASVLSSIEKSNFQINVSKERLEWLVLEDFINNDVPYLTEYRSKIYYGSCTIDENMIAVRQ